MDKSLHGEFLARHTLGAIVINDEVERRGWIKDLKSITRAGQVGSSNGRVERIDLVVEEGELVEDDFVSAWVRDQTLRIGCIKSVEYLTVERNFFGRVECPRELCLKCEALSYKLVSSIDMIRSGKLLFLRS